jgi:uncharacterized protein
VQRRGNVAPPVTLYDCMPSFLTAVWRHLVFLNYEVDAALVAPFVPAGTEIDLLDGKAVVSVVGFRFTDTRLLGVPVPFHQHFDEVNLRAYVRRHVRGEWRRGVVFVRELVPRAAIAWTARLAYNEPYRAVPMRHQIALDATFGGTVRYEWRQAGRWHHVAAAVQGSSMPIDPDSDVGFITEHYHGYTPQRSGRTVEYHVAHDRWRYWNASSSRLECDVSAVYGPEWTDPLSHAPISAFVCDGAPVSISFPATLPR